MEILDYIILGLVQGLTEFLPVSSSGHLILAQHVLGLNPAGVTTEVILHLATLISVLVVYGRDLLQLLHERKWRYISALALATVITVAIILPFKDQLEALADSDMAVRLVGFSLLFTALLLFIAEQAASRRPASDSQDLLSAPGWGQTIAAGLAQALAVMPGVSRSGSTISALLLGGLDYAAAARFSFLLSIPVILGAGILKLADLASAPAAGTVPVIPLLAGFIAAALSGVLAIRFLLAMLKRRRLYMFSIYCLLIGILAISLG